MSPSTRLLLALITAFGLRLALIIRSALAGRLSRRRYREAKRREIRREIDNFKRDSRPLVRLVITEAFENGNGNARERIDNSPELDEVEPPGSDQGGNGDGGPDLSPELDVGEVEPLGGGDGPDGDLSPEKDPGGRVSRINQQAIDVLTDNLSGSLEAAATQIGRRADDVFRREGLRQALSQLENELPESAAARQMRERLEREGMVTFLDRSGRHWDLQTYAEMAVRTTTQEAISQGVIAQMTARGFDLVEVIGEHDCQHHPKDPSHPCRAYEGKVFSLTGATPGYPKLDEAPPFHPRCTHSLLPAVAGVGALLDRELAAA